jgi:hypothetical protein
VTGAPLYGGPPVNPDTTARVTIDELIADLDREGTERALVIPDHGVPDPTEDGAGKIAELAVSGAPTGLSRSLAVAAASSTARMACPRRRHQAWEPVPPVSAPIPGGSLLCPWWHGVKRAPPGGSSTAPSA